MGIPKIESKTDSGKDPGSVMLGMNQFQRDRMNLEMTWKINCKGCADASAASPNYFDHLQSEHQRLHVCPWIPLTETQALFAKDLNLCHCKLTFSSV